MTNGQVVALIAAMMGAASWIRNEWWFGTVLFVIGMLALGRQ